MFASGRQEIEKRPKDADRLHRIANRMFASALEFDASALNPTISRLLSMVCSRLLASDPAG